MYIPSRVSIPCNGESVYVHSFSILGSELLIRHSLSVVKHIENLKTVTLRRCLYKKLQRYRSNFTESQPRLLQIYDTSTGRLGYDAFGSCQDIIHGAVLFEGI